jgi:glycosyltransferase involved in cell wall biosynthesis
VNLVAIMPARNEGWVLGLSARAVLMWCDSLVILDHASTDDTADIIARVSQEHPGRVFEMRESQTEWREMHHRQELLDCARMIGATHVAPVDADEVLSANLIDGIRGRIEALAPGTFCGIPMKNLHRSINRYRADNSPFGSQAGTMLAFADAAHLGWKPRNGYDHHQRSPHGSRMGQMIRCEGGLLHLQFASWRRLVDKHRAYRVLERLKYPQKPVSEIERLYSLATNEKGLETKETPAEWLDRYADLMQYVDLERKPWQADYVDEMIDLHGIEMFSGLRVKNGDI